MSPKLSFLDLPSEIRHAIYLHYIAVENGYVFNFDTGKLAALGSDGKMKPIDHALKFTCKTVAQEMMGLDFQVNPIKFSTGYSNQWRINAARFHNMQAYFNYVAVSMLQGPGPEDHDADSNADSNADQGDARESRDENRDPGEGGERDAGTSLNTSLNENVDSETINDHVQDHDQNHIHDHDQEQEQDEDNDQDGDEDQDEDEDEDENTNEQTFLLAVQMPLWKK